VAASDTGGMGEFRGSADEPDHGDRPEPHGPPTGGDVGAVRARVEPRSRTEYAADLEQRAVSEWEPQAFTYRTGEPMDNTDHHAADGAAHRPSSPDAPPEVVQWSSGSSRDARD
jgi:hypothetical protein